MEKSGVKRASSGGDGPLDHIKAGLIDVEGTVTPATFVKDVLVKYVNENVESYVTTHFASETVEKHVEGLRKQATEDIAAGLEGAVVIPEANDDVAAVASAVAANVKSQFDHDRCSKDAGALYYEMIVAAFKAKAVAGKVFDDATPALKKLTISGIKVYAYAECCADSAKLQLEHSDHGDLTALFSGFYDHIKLGTKLGSTLTEKGTFTKLASELQVDVDQLLFLTSKPKDAEAANSAGLKTCLVRAEKTDTTETLRSVKSLGELFDSCCESGDGSPLKKHRSSGDHHDDGEHVEGKVCVETGCDGDKKHSDE